MKPVTGIPDGYRAYALSSRDISKLSNAQYKTGDVLIFSATISKPRPGQELAVAATINAAVVYLNGLKSEGRKMPLELPESKATFGQRRHDRETEASAPHEMPGATLPAFESPTRGDATGRLESTIAAKDQEISQLKKSLKASEDSVTEVKSHYEKLIGNLNSTTSRLENELAEQTDQVSRLSKSVLLQDEMATMYEGDFESLASCNSRLAEELEDAQAQIRQMIGDQGEAILVSLEKDRTIEALQNKLVDFEALQRRPPDFEVGGMAGSDLVQTDGGAVRVYHTFPPKPEFNHTRYNFSQIRASLYVILIILLLLVVFYMASLLLSIESSGVNMETYASAFLGKLVEPFRTFFSWIAALVRFFMHLFA